jgi:hypothetical protein
VPPRRIVIDPPIVAMADEPYVNGIVRRRSPPR